MESTEAPTRLDRLAAELIGRGWKAEFLDGRVPVLRVSNPRVPELNDTVVLCDGGAVRWSWGADVWPVADVVAVADRITYVLREVSG